MATRDLSLEEASRCAASLWLDESFLPTAQKLIYYVLAMDAREPIALSVLVRYLDAYTTNDKVLAMAIYALSVVEDPKLVRALSEIKQLMMIRLGLLTPKSVPLPAEPWLNPDAYNLDEQKYHSLIDPLLEDDGTKLLNAVRLLIGLKGNAVTHVTLGATVPEDQFSEFYHPERFVETLAYAEFLIDDKFRAEGAPREDEIEKPTYKWFKETDE